MVVVTLRVMARLSEILTKIWKLSSVHYVAVCVYNIIYNISDIHIYLGTTYGMVELQQVIKK